mgnify:CR=1 FL=1|jgi:hypothetical protein|tara:strand:+ start:288 stop:494 length:207 start_codon:yes stop_codon:yes gene_type:complete
MMKVGELVNFHANGIFSGANDRYKNPGIVLRVTGIDQTRGREVLWADGRITKEYTSYLRSVGNDIKDS